MHGQGFSLVVQHVWTFRQVQQWPKPALLCAHGLLWQKVNRHISWWPPCSIEHQTLLQVYVMEQAQPDRNKRSRLAQRGQSAAFIDWPSLLHRITYSTVYGWAMKWSSVLVLYNLLPPDPFTLEGPA